MTSRRNFVIGAGTLLTGSGTFLGSGAFEVSAGEGPSDWIPVSTSTTPPEETESSVGIRDDERSTPEQGEGRPDDGTDTPDGEDREDDDPQGGPGPDPDPGEDRDDEDEDDDPDPDPDPRLARETSVRLDAAGSGILDSPHVLTNGDGTLQGLSLENVNMNALTYVGETTDGRYPRPSAGDRVAFRVVNDGDVAVDLRAEVRGGAPGVLNFPSWVDPAVRGPSQRDLTGVTVESLQPGQSVSVVVEVDTTGVGEVPPDAVEGVTFVADPV